MLKILIRVKTSIVWTCGNYCHPLFLLLLYSLDLLKFFRALLSFWNGLLMIHWALVWWKSFYPHLINFDQSRQHLSRDTCNRNNLPIPPMSTFSTPSHMILHPRKVTKKLSLGPWHLTYSMKTTTSMCFLYNYPSPAVLKMGQGE